MTDLFSTPPPEWIRIPDRPEIVRNLTPEELQDWLPYVGSLADGVRAVWMDLLRTPDWEPVPEGVRKRCRHPKCQEMGVAELRRTGRRGRVTWWAYCASHAWGQWVVMGDESWPDMAAPMLLARRLIGAPTPPEE